MERKITDFSFGRYLALSLFFLLIRLSEDILHKDRILITGVTGLLGGHLLGYLRAKYEVHAIVRTVPEYADESVNYIPFDLAQPLDLSILPEKIDAVVHLAQANNHRGFPLEALDIFEVNAGATARLIDYAHKSGAKSFLLASTGGLYAPSFEPLTELSPMGKYDGPLAFYFMAKQCAEKIIEPYRELMGITVIRPFFIYGAGQRETMLFPRLIKSVGEGIPINLAGGSGITINPIHAEDAAKAILSLLESTDAPPLVNFAGPENISIREIAEIIGREFGKSPVYEGIDGESSRIVSDISVLRSFVDWPLHHVAQGIKMISQQP